MTDLLLALLHLAVAAAQKCLELLSADTINEQATTALRQAAEQKIAKLKPMSSR